MQKSHISDIFFPHENIFWSIVTNAQLIKTIIKKLLKQYIRVGPV